MLTVDMLDRYDDLDNSELIKGEEDKEEKKRLQEKLNKLSNELTKAHEEYKLIKGE